MSTEQNEPGSLPPDAQPAAVPPAPPKPPAQPGGQAAIRPDPGEQLVSDTTIEQALAHAWHRFNSYDNQSNDLKTRYRRVRTLIIVASFLTTLLAVMSVLGDLQPIIRVTLIGLGTLLLAIAIRLWFYDTTLPPARGWFETRPRAWKVFIRLARWLGVAVFAAAGGGVWLVSAVIADVPAWPEVMAVLSPIFQIMLIALPLASAGLLAFASRFEAGNAWVTYRIAAETIKRAVYTLRVRRNLETIQAKHLLSLYDTVSTAQLIIQDSGVITPFESNDRSLNDELIRPNYVDAPALDNGYAPITLAQYLDWRLTPQANWYRKRIREQYPAARQFRATILFVGAVGALLAALGLGEFVAVTVAGATALTAYLSLQQYEQNYGVYSHTIAKLEDTTIKHRILAGKDEHVLDQLAFVEAIEGIMADERALWRIGVLQGQNTTEETLNKLVSTHGVNGPNFRQLAGLQTDEEGEGKGEEPGSQPGQPETP